MVGHPHPLPEEEARYLEETRCPLARISVKSVLSQRAILAPFSPGVLRNQPWLPWALSALRWPMVTTPRRGRTCGSARRFGGVRQHTGSMSARKTPLPELSYVPAAAFGGSIAC